MFKKYCKDLLFEEVEMLIKNNDDLREQLVERGIENAGFWVEEYLHNAPRNGCNWSITYGYSYGDYFNITNNVEFEKWYSDLQNDYYFLSDEDNEIVQKYLHYAEIYDHVNYLWEYGRAKDKDLERLEEITSDLLEESEKLIFKRLRSEFDYFLDAGEKELAHYFDLWLDNKTDETGSDLFTDNRLTNIYEHIPTTIIPAHGRIIA